MNKLTITLAFLVMLSSPVASEPIKLICKYENPDNTYAEEFAIFVDPNLKSMKTEVYGNIQQTVIFSERYIMNLQHSINDLTGRSGGAIVTLDRYTGEALFQIQTLDNFDELKKLKKMESQPSLQTIYKCEKRKV